MDYNSNHYSLMADSELVINEYFYAIYSMSRSFLLMACVCYIEATKDKGEDHDEFYVA